jgi:hypothetical protein
LTVGDKQRLAPVPTSLHARRIGFVFTISRGAKSSGGLSMVGRCGKIEFPQMTSGAKPQ